MRRRRRRRSRRSRRTRRSRNRRRRRRQFGFGLDSVWIRFGFLTEGTASNIALRYIGITC